MSRKERIILILLASINFTHILDFMIMMPLGNYLMPFFDINPRQFTTLVGSYPITAAASGFVAAFFVDKYDRKKILMGAYIGFLIGTLACGFAPSYGLLLAARVLTGLFGGLIGAQVLSIVADIFRYERRGAAMGSVMSAFAIASTLGVPFSLYLANIFSWHAPFIFVGIVGALLIPFLFRYIPSMKEHTVAGGEKKLFEVLLVILRSREQRLALVFSALLMMGHFLIIPFINPYMEFNKGYTKDQTPLIYLFGGIASFFAAIILGRVADQVGKLKVFSICILLSFVMVYTITNLPPIAFSLVLAMFAVWFILATGRGVTAQAMISNVVKPEQRGSYMSFNSSVQQLGTAMASFIAGYVVTQDAAGRLINYEWVGYLSIIVLLIALLIANFLFARMDRREPALVEVLENPASVSPIASHDTQGVSEG